MGHQIYDLGLHMTITVTATTVGLLAILSLLIIYVLGTIAVLYWVFTNTSHLSIRVGMVVRSLRFHTGNGVKLGITRDVIDRSSERTESSVYMSAPGGAANNSTTPLRDKIDDEIKDEPYYATLTHDEADCTSLDLDNLQISIKKSPHALSRIPYLRQPAPTEQPAERSTPAQGNDAPIFSYDDISAKKGGKMLCVLVPNSKLGNKLIANLMVQQFVDVLSVASLAMNCLLLYTPEITNKYVVAVLVLQIVVCVLAKLSYSLIMTAFTKPVVANALDGLAQKNGICYQVRTNLKSSVGAEVLPDSDPGAALSLEKWRTIVWNTRSEDPRRKFWCKSEGIGVQYSEAVDAAEEAYQLTDDATRSAILLCVTYITGIVAIIAVSIAGYEVIAKAPVTVLGIVVALASSTLSYSCLSTAQLANAAVHARRSRATLNGINDEITLAPAHIVREYITGAAGVFDEGHTLMHRVGSLLARLGYMCRFVFIPAHFCFDKHCGVECEIILYNGNMRTGISTGAARNDRNRVGQRTSGNRRSEPASNDVAQRGARNAAAGGQLQP